MKIAVVGKVIDQSLVPWYKDVFQFFQSKKISVSLYEPFRKELEKNKIPVSSFKTFSDSDKPNDYDFFYSMGGDGTLLHTAFIVGKTNIPIVGINTGRLGFLANIPKENIKEKTEQILKGKYVKDARSVLTLESKPQVFRERNFALNDFTIHKHSTSSMIKIHTFLNGKFLNTYWADGIVVSTPTGSTGYSLSCGGPIVMPDAKSLIITPVAPHSLSVRPLVVSDENEISFQLEGNLDRPTGGESEFLASLDSRSEPVTSKHKLSVRKGDFQIQLVSFSDNHFPDTLRNKLMWGLDKRN